MAICKLLRRLQIWLGSGVAMAVTVASTGGPGVFPSGGNLRIKLGFTHCLLLPKKQKRKKRKKRKKERDHALNYKHLFTWSVPKFGIIYLFLILLLLLLLFLGPLPLHMEVPRLGAELEL